MQVHAAKSEVLGALRERARPFETQLSNPASQAAHRQLTDQIALLENTPGETVPDVQKALRAVAAEERADRNQAGLIAGGLFLGLGVSLALCGGPSSNGWIQGFNILGLMVGAGASLRALQHEEQNRNWLKAADSLENLAPTVAVSDTGNLRGTPTVSLDGPPTLTQLRDLLGSTGSMLESLPQPELAAARQQIQHDLKRLARYQGPTLDEARQQVDARLGAANKVFKVLPFTLGAGVVSIFLDGMLPGAALVGAGLILSTFAATVTGALVGSNAQEARQALDCWQPQLQALRDLDTAGQEMRDWGKTRGPGVVEGQGSVMVGGVRIPVKRR